MGLLNATSAIDQRQWERYILNKPATLVSLGNGLRGLTTRHCQVIDISIGGAAVQVITTIGLPDHYYLGFLGTEELLGVAEVNRNGTRIGLRFIKLLDDQQLNKILRR